MSTFRSNCLEEPLPFGSIVPDFSSQLVAFLANFWFSAGKIRSFLPLA